MINKKVGILIGILVLGNIFFGYSYFMAYKNLQVKQDIKAKMESNSKIIDFTSLFIKKVLQADKEVDFETRLSLENAVRELKDAEIMAEWQKFTSSKTEIEAQDSVKKLLEILITKIQK